jgi:hypothetical protein
MTEAYSVKEMLTEIRLDQREHNERSIRMEEVQLKQGEVLNAVLEQAKATNGRVTKLEQVNEKKDGAYGFAKYIGIFVATCLLGYLGWLGAQINKIDNVLSAYEIEVQ